MNSRTLLLCSLLFILLVAGDIITTVWFTALGLQEANPVIAPIAGDALAQVCYKGPFIAVLLVSVVMLSRRCDRMRPGLGWGPWVVVLVMFAVPPVWNLMHIAGYLWL